MSHECDSAHGMWGGVRQQAQEHLWHGHCLPVFSVPCLRSLSLGTLALLYEALPSDHPMSSKSVYCWCRFLLLLFSSVGFKIVIIKHTKWPVQYKYSLYLLTHLHQAL